MVRKYKITGLIILLMFGFISGWSQNLDVPREKIVTHLSQQCLFPGEHLWLTVYVSNYSDLPGKQISNLAFVEFVDSRNTSLIRKKIMLKNGVGICAFSIPDSLSTGICQVMVYTNWLKNFGESSYSKTKVMVFNPNSPVNEESLTSKIPSIKAKETSNTGFGIQTNKTEYSTREKVILKFDFDTLQFKSANLSISARQKEPLQMRDITRREVDLPDFEIQNINHYPDYKGILLSGKILNKINNLPVQDEEIILSFPGEFVEIKYAHSNQNGEFSFLLEPNAGELDLVFNLPSDEHMVKLDEPFVNGFVQIPGQLDLKFTDATIQYLKDRFIKYQLSRRFGYANVENIVIEEKIRQTDFFGEAYQRVVFKDYKKLDSISEYFYELIPTVHFSIRQGEQQLYITNPETNFKLGDNPAVFIDGVYYPGLKELAALDYNLVKEISVVPKVYYYREKIYDGIVSVKTNSNNFNQVEQLKNMVRIIYPVSDFSPSFKIQNSVSFGEEQKRIPDLRSLLHWQSNLIIDTENPGTVSFYTGDIKGEFVISLVGLTNTGEFIQLEKTINVISD